MTELKDKVADAIIAWQDPNNPERSLNALSEKSGVNRSYLSHIANKKHEIAHKDRPASPIPDNIYYRLASAIGVEVNVQVHVDCAGYESVTKACRYAQQTQRRVLLDGPSGSGKTYGLMRYQMQNDKVLYVKCTSRMKGKDLIADIVKQLRLNLPANMTDTAKLSEIAAKVAVPGYLIIIDEAESVNPDIYRVIKDLEDATYRKCGMILCGMGLIAELEHGAKLRKKLFPQLLRRFRANRKVLRDFTKTMVADACRQYGISDRDVVKYMQERVADMAMLNEWLTDILELLQGQGHDITPDNVRGLMEL